MLYLYNLNPQNLIKMENKLKYNVHHAINFRSWRKYLVNDYSLNYHFIQAQFHAKYFQGLNTGLSIYKNPQNRYNIYHPISGKIHSEYPKNPYK